MTETVKRDYKKPALL